MKYYLGFLSIIFSVTANCQTNPFDSLKFDKVVMYDYDGRLENLIVDKNGKLDKSVSKQVTLDKKTADELNQRLGTKSSYEDGVLMCFSPHLGLVYYNKEKIVASISICLMCNRLESSVIIPAQVIDTIEDKAGIYYQMAGIMSANLVEYINDLVKSHKFSHPKN